MSKKILAFVMALVLVISLVPAVAAAETDYVQITSADQLVTGQYVLVAGNGYAPTALDGTWVLSGTPVVNNGTIAAADAAGYIWTITVDGTTAKLTDANGVTVAPKGGNNNGIISADYSWDVLFSDGTFQFAGVGSDTVILACNSGSQGGNKFRGYKTTTVTGSYASDYSSYFTLYKLGGDVPAVPEVTEPVVKPTEPVVVPTDPVEIVKEAYALAPNASLPYKATLTGKINSVKTAYDSNYDNITVVIAVEGCEDMPITCFRLKGNGADQIDLGDTITVSGYITNYQHSSGDCEVEFTAGCTLDSWVAGGSTTPSEPQVTEPTEPTTPPETAGALNTGDEVVIFAPAYNKALSAEKVDANSFYNKGVDVTVDNGTVSGYGDAEIWTVTNNGDGTYSFANGGQNIGLGDSFSSMNLGEIHDDWQLISLGGSLYNLKNVGRGNFMEWYASKDNWSTYNSAKAATDDQFQLSFYVIGTGILGEEVEPSEPTPTVPDVTEPIVEPTEPSVAPSEPEAEPTYGVVTAPQAGVAYKMGMNKNEGNILFFNGQTENETVTYRLATVAGTAEAIDVYLETVDGVEGGYRLYFMNGDTKTYIRVFHRTDGNPGYGKGSLELVTDVPAEYFTYDSVANTLVYDYDGNNAYYMGTYSTFTTFSVSNTSYITGDNASNVDLSQYPARFYAAGVVEEPEDTKPTEPEDTKPSAPSEPEVTEPTTPVEPVDGSFVQITSADQLVTGKYVLVAGNGYAPTVLDGTWVLSGTPTVANGVVSAENAAGYIWDITVEGTTAKLTDANGVTVAPKGGNNNGIISADYSWDVLFSDGTFQFAGVGSDTVILACNSGSMGGNQFRGYKTTTLTGSYAHEYFSYFTLYKLEESTEPEQVAGDLTGDGSVNNDDVVLLLWHTLFPEDYPLTVNADLNSDGNVNNDDVVLLLWHTLFPEDYPL